MSNIPEEGEGFGAYCLGATGFRFVSLSEAFRVLYVSFSGVRGVGWHRGFIRRGLGVVGA